MSGSTRILRRWNQWAQKTTSTRTGYYGWNWRQKMPNSEMRTTFACACRNPDWSLSLSLSAIPHSSTASSTSQATNPYWRISDVKRQQLALQPEYPPSTTLPKPTRACAGILIWRLSVSLWIFRMKLLRWIISWEERRWLCITWWGWTRRRESRGKVLLCRFLVCSE